MNKICLISQPAGIGDIFVCQKIAKTIQAMTEYKTILWPVWPIYSYLSDYLIGEDIHFFDDSESFEHKEIYLSNRKEIIQTENLLYLPLQTSNYVMKSCKCHQNPYAQCAMKYNFCNIEHEDWASYFEFKRDFQRENKLFEALNLDLSVPYNLINNNYGTFPHFASRHDLIPQNNYKNVYMNFYEGTTLFDWIKVFENAYEIHTMATSVPFILEKLKLDRVVIYSRYHGEELQCARTFYNKNWKYELK